jgi:PAS domain S-box-containing protein
MLTHIINSIPQSVFWKNRDSIYLGCNIVFAKRIDIDNTQEIVGKTDFDLPIPQDYAEAYRADDAKVMATGKVERHIEPLQLRNGAKRWLDTTKVPLVNESGAVYGVLGVSDDVTERLTEQEKLRYKLKP